jgi:hypothetical protein
MLLELCDVHSKVHIVNGMHITTCAILTKFSNGNDTSVHLAIPQFSEGSPAGLLALVRLGDS